jgi:UDP-glucose 4-epimerase
LLTRHVVTGGAGFIGSHIAEALARRGNRVVVLDDLSTGKLDNLSPIAGAVDFEQTDLAASTRLPQLLAGVDTVFHQAALPSVPESVRDPVRSHAANVNATLNLLLACRDAGVRRVVYASSCALYGDGPGLPRKEDMPASPQSPYGTQKYIGELYMQTFWRTYGLETVSLRYFNVFGPRQDPGSEYSGVIAKFIPAVLRGETPVIYGDGTQSRDFVFVSDVVDANLRAGEAGNVAGGVFNVARGRRVAIDRMLGQILRIAGRTVAPSYAPARPGDILHSEANVDLARRHLGWNPETSFERGLELTLDWYRQELG